MTKASTLLAEADSARTRGDLAAAVVAYQHASELDPQSTYARYWLATCHQQLGNLDLALQHCRAGIAIEPGQIGLLLRMGAIATAAEDHKLALDVYLRAAALDPEIPDIDALLADQYGILGNAAAAVRYFDRALQRDPVSTQLQSNRLFVLNYASILSQQELFEEHRRWGEVRQSRFTPEWTMHANTRDPDRRIRVGYVSGDLRNHAISFFIEPLLRQHDRTQFDIFCYDASLYAEDAVTTRLKALGSTWRRVAGQADDALARVIRDDQIDILVDLSGHTMMNRLLVFARKPAPVQATWLGYLGTTGLTAIDYRITDAFLDPPGTTDRFHTEMLYHLPHACCFAPRSHEPEPGELPALRNGYVTFGSVNQWSKVNVQVIDTWAEILRSCEDSRLIVIARGAQNPLFVTEIQAQFSARGVDTSRVTAHPMLSLDNFLSLFESLDLTLDPFPYGGGTTTMHSLWMGVPVITLAGSCAFARNSIGPLTTLGMSDLVATSPADYAAKAMNLASDLDRLRVLRHELRRTMRASPLMAQARFTRSMEDALREMWRSYCGGDRHVGSR